MTRSGPHADLLEEADACERELTRYPGDEPDHARARAMLCNAATACRTGAEVFDADPTLADEPWQTGRLGPLDILAELPRQLRGFLRGTVFSRSPKLHDWPRAERWAEADAIDERLRLLAPRIRAVLPRDTTTPAALQAVSQARLAAYHSDVAAAADSLRNAIAAALRQSNPDPRALALADLAEHLQAEADNLAAEHSAAGDVLAACLRRDDSQPTAAEQPRSVDHV